MMAILDLLHALPLDTTSKGTPPPQNNFYAPGLIVAALAVGMATPFLLRGLRVWPKARFACARRCIRQVRRMRKFYRASPIVDFAATLTLVSLLTIVALYFVIRQDRLYRQVMAIWGAQFALCGALECIQRARRLVRFAWARTMGKVGMASLAAVVGGIAHVIARAVAFSIHPIDPAHYPNFVLLLALVLTPALYAYAMALLIAAWAYLEITLALLAPLLNSIPRMLARLLSREHILDEHLYRLVYGRRSSYEPRRSLFNDGTILGVRMFSMTGFVLGLFFVANSLLTGHEAFLMAQLRKAVVLTDYQHGAWCGLDPADHYLRLDDKKVSVAHWHDGVVTFGTTTCPATE